MANLNRFHSNPLLGVPLQGVRIISMHDACLSVVKTSGVYRYQFESQADLRAAFSAWCEQQAQLAEEDQGDGLNIAVLRH